MLHRSSKLQSKTVSLFTLARRNFSSMTSRKGPETTNHLEAAYKSLAGCMIPDRTSFSALQIIEDIGTHLHLPLNGLRSVDLPGEGHILKSSFRIADLAQASISLSALSAALVYSICHNTPTLGVSVERLHAVLEFASERLYSNDGKPARSAWGPLSGLHKAKDGYVRIHDGFPNLSRAATSLLGLPDNATREQVGEVVKDRQAEALEEDAGNAKAVIYRLRTAEEWDETPQAKAISDYPVSIRKFSSSGLSRQPFSTTPIRDRCLAGVRVLDLSRVIAAPVAGRTLASHGADVLWITSPSLPSIPPVDTDVNRGKRRVYIDLNSSSDSAKLEELIKHTDVLIQAYRPGALAAKGLTPERLAELRPGIIIANLSAWGNEGPWRERRGFDSIVQTVSGLNDIEDQHFSSAASNPAAKPLPVQALDHAAGYFLATGILAALYHHKGSGGTWEVNVSLAAVGKYLRSLGQLPGKEGFEGNTKSPEEWLAEAVANEKDGDFLEKYDTGKMKAVRHSGTIQGMRVGVDGMCKEVEVEEVKWS